MQVFGLAELSACVYFLRADVRDFLHREAGGGGHLAAGRAGFPPLGLPLDLIEPVGRGVAILPAGQAPLEFAVQPRHLAPVPPGVPHLRRDRPTTA